MNQIFIFSPLFIKQVEDSRWCHCFSPSFVTERHTWLPQAHKRVLHLHAWSCQSWSWLLTAFCCDITSDNLVLRPKKKKKSPHRWISHCNWRRQRAALTKALIADACHSEAIQQQRANMSQPRNQSWQATLATHQWTGSRITVKCHTPCQTMFPGPRHNEHPRGPLSSCHKHYLPPHVFF